MVTNFARFSAWVRVALKIARILPGHLGGREQAFSRDGEETHGLEEKRRVVTSEWQNPGEV